MIKESFKILAFMDTPTHDSWKSPDLPHTAYYSINEHLSFTLWGICGDRATLSVSHASLDAPIKRLLSSFEENTPTQMHQHDYIELLYVVQGCFSKNIAGKDFTFGEGDVVFINQGIFHYDYLRKQDACILFVNIPYSIFEHLFYNSIHSPYQNYIANLLLERHSGYSHIHGSPKPQLPAVGETQTLRSLYEIVCEILRPSPGSTHIIKGHLIRLIYALTLEYRFTLLEHTQADMRRQLYEDIVNDIRQNCASISIEALQNKYFFNRDYFNRLIKAFSGYTFRELRQNLRLDEAQRLLTTTDRRVSDIALAVGYENLGFFYRIFSEKFGKTPRAYRLSEQSSPVGGACMRNRPLL